MTHFIKQGSRFMVAPEEAIDIRDHLPAGNYLVGQTQMGYHLEITDTFGIDFKIYGDTTKDAQRILATYRDRPNATGVLLAGEKGSGKTLLAKLLAQEAAKQYDMPTLIVTKPYHGDGFNALLQQIHQPCIVIFDEFEKVYDSDHQKEILTLFDGVFPTKKLFVLTVNDPWKIDTHMKNRPGRLFYFREYDGLDETFIREYCVDTLKNQKHIDMLCRTLVLFDKFNFDMLKALVEEMNRYGETPQQALRFLNIRPDIKKYIYEITTTLEGIECKNSQSRWQGNPLTDSIEFYVYQNDKDGNPIRKKTKKKSLVSNPVAAVILTNGDEDEDELDPIEIKIIPERITRMDAREGVYTYLLKEENIVVTLTKEKKSVFNFYDYAY